MGRDQKPIPLPWRAALFGAVLGMSMSAAPGWAADIDAYAFDGYNEDGTGFFASAESVNYALEAARARKQQQQQQQQEPATK